MSATKASTGATPAAIALCIFLLPSLSVAAIRAAIQDRYPFLAPLNEVLRYGVAFHHSTVPHLTVRRLIEDAGSHKSLRVVAATTTLAETTCRFVSRLSLTGCYGQMRRPTLGRSLLLFPPTSRGGPDAAGVVHRTRENRTPF